MAKQRARPKPANFHAKLKQIRQALGYSQNEMLRALGLAEKSNRSLISGFELGTKEPNLLVILNYARLANLSTDYLLDDELNLPDELPALMTSFPTKQKLV